MNKYQEALNNLKEPTEEWLDKKLQLAENMDEPITFEHQSDINILQELVDKSTTKWIPVEERLPENEKYIGCYYLVTLEYRNLNMNSVTCARFEPSGRWLRYCAIGEVDVTDEVIAWMPLPEAYGDGQ